MSLIILGINHKTAPLEVREHLAYTPESLVDAIQSLSMLPWVFEVVITSTCNRTEWIVHLEDEHQAQLIEWIAINKGLSPENFTHNLYCHQDREAVAHLMKVACGLDSMVLGEPQILGQVKAAYSLAKDLNTISDQLEKLFQLTFATAKKIRTETAIGKSATSVAFIAVRLAKQIFPELNHTSILLVGAGDTIERVAKHLKEQSATNLTVLNRSLEKADALAAKVQGQSGHISELSQHLNSADIVISSTASTLPIIGKGVVENALNHNKRRPVIMIDLAVPRDIEPEVGKLKDIYLYCIDDLQQVADDNLKSRQIAATKADDIIADAVETFFSWLKSLDAIHLIRNYRSNMNQIKKQELTRAVKRLSKGDSADTIMEEFASRLINKLMHKTCDRIRNAGQTGKTDLLKSAKELLEIDS